MATEGSFADYVLEQADLGERLTRRKMFGEYGFHLDGSFVAMACDNSFFVKETAAIRELDLDLPRRPPYPDAKPWPVADELLDDAPLLNQLLRETAKHLPPPRPRKRKR